MGRSTDALLAALSLGLFCGALLASGAPLSPAWAGLGALAVVAFEVAALRHREAVYRRWDRPAVKLGAVALAVCLVGVGFRAAPSRLLSAGIGSLSAYLLVLALFVGLSNRW